MIYIGNNTVTTAKSATYLGNVGYNLVGAELKAVKAGS